MKEGEYFFIADYNCECEEDVFGEGEIGGGYASGWDMGTGPVVNHEFASVYDALLGFCDAHYFTFNPEWWEFGDYGNGMRFWTDILVDNDNNEASESEIERWKKGEIRLWNCHISVHIKVRTVSRELTDEELNNWKETK